MTNYQRYKEMTKKVEDVYGSELVDMCVDAENCEHINDNSEEFWANMCTVFQATVGYRLSEMGVSSKEMVKVGIYY
jgi:hypothetical protein